MSVPGGSARRLAMYLTGTYRLALSSAWEAPREAVMLRRLANIGPEKEGLRSASWVSALARVSLTDAEREHWASVDLSLRRRNEWLLGRVAIKDAVRAWAASRTGLALRPRDVMVQTNEAGAPYVRSELLEAAGAIPKVSLSHTSTLIVAGASPPASRLGVDVERVDRNVAMLERALSERECEVVRESDFEVIDVLVAKEAVAKAAGTGLAGSLAHWPVVSVEPDARRIHVRAAVGEAAGQEFEVLVSRRAGHALAVCYVT